jgi:hypothetical protein
MTRRIVLRATAIILASFAYIAIIVSAEDESAHEACLSYAISSTGHLYMHVYSDARGTTLDRWDKRLGGTSHVDTTYYVQLHPPAAGTGEIAWPEGVQLAENMRAKGRDFWVTSEPTTSATWEHAPFSREDIWRFNTADHDGNPTQYVFRSTLCDGWNNCPGPGPEDTSHHCFNRTETCCGEGTMSPKCLAKNTTDQCCKWFLSSKTCEKSQVCCGGMGPGTTSYAFCCDAGSTCCNTRGRTTGMGVCCPSGTTCCGGIVVAVCCNKAAVCDLENQACVVGILSPPSTASPAPATAELSTMPASFAPSSETPTTPASGQTAGPSTTSIPNSSTNALQPNAPSSTTASTTAPAVISRHHVVEAAITIPGASFGKILADRNARELLRQALVRDLAVLLQVSTFDVLVRNMREGSLIVNCFINHSSSTAAAATLARALALPVNNVTLQDTTQEYLKANAVGSWLTVSHVNAFLGTDDATRSDSAASPVVIAPMLTASVAALLALFFL